MNIQGNSGFGCLQVTWVLSASAYQTNRIMRGPHKERAILKHCRDIYWIPLTKLDPFVSIHKHLPRGGSFSRLELAGSRRCGLSAQMLRRTGRSKSVSHVASKWFWPQMERASAWATKSEKTEEIKSQSFQNKLASLEATLVRNSADLINDLITHRGKV